MVYIFIFINALLIYGATSSDSVQVGGSIGNVHKNAPYVVENFYAIMSIISLLMVTAFLNVAAARDFNYNTHQIIFSTPLRKFDFLMGRFWGAVVIAIIPFLGVSIGNIIGSLMPWLDAERIGPRSGVATLPVCSSSLFPTSFLQVHLFLPLQPSPAAPFFHSSPLSFYWWVMELLRD